VCLFEYGRGILGCVSEVLGVVWKEEVEVNVYREVVWGG
jgi:hypothetical protein